MRFIVLVFTAWIHRPLLAVDCPGVHAVWTLHAADPADTWIQIIQMAFCSAWLCPDGPLILPASRNSHSLCRVSSLTVLDQKMTRDTFYQASTDLDLTPSSSQQTQTICITFIQCWTSVEDAGPTFYKCYAYVLCLLRRRPVCGSLGIQQNIMNSKLILYSSRQRYDIHHLPVCML